MKFLSALEAMMNGETIKLGDFLYQYNDLSKDIEISYDKDIGKDLCTNTDSFTLQEILSDEWTIKDRRRTE